MWPCHTAVGRPDKAQVLLLALVFSCDVGVTLGLETVSPEGPCKGPGVTPAPPSPCASLS